MPSAFITRDLAPNSDFRRILTAQGWQVTGQSLVLLTPLPFPAVPPCDWIFFSSQNAVRWFFEQAAQLPDWTAERAQAVRWAAIGPATGRALAGHVERVDFVGTGEPEETAMGFREAAAPARVNPGVVLLPAARHSEKNLLHALQPHFQCIQLAVYDNQPLPKPPLRTDDVLVFTSPMNVRTYFERNVLQEQQRVVAMGNTTARALESWGAKHPALPPSTTEAGLAAVVLHLARTS